MADGGIELELWQLVLAAIVAVTGVAGSIWGIINGRRASSLAADTAQSEESDRIEARATALREYADAAAEKAVAARIKPLTDHISEQQERLEEQQRETNARTRAFTRILRQIAAQWPVGTPGPHLDPDDIAQIEDTIPSPWLPPMKGTP